MISVGFSFDLSPLDAARAAGLGPARRSRTSPARAGEPEAANGRFDIIVHYRAIRPIRPPSRTSGSPLVADHHRRHSGRLRRLHRRSATSTPASCRSTASAGILGQAGPDLLRPGSRLPAHRRHGVRLRRRRQHVRERHVDQRHPARDGAHPRHRDDLEPCSVSRTARRLHRGPRPRRIPRARPAIRRRYRFRSSTMAASGTASAHWDEDTLQRRTDDRLRRIRPASPCRSAG